MAANGSWLNRGWRLFRNRCVDARDVRAKLPQPALDRLTAQIAASEQKHQAEIRLCIEAGLPWDIICQDATPRARALMLFGQLRVWDTEHNNGLLIYLLMAERAIEIIADRGLKALIPAEQLQAITAELSHKLAETRYEEGLSHTIKVVSDLLIDHFPRHGEPKAINELPDEPVILF